MNEIQLQGTPKMIDSKEFLKNHKQLSQANVKFLEFVDKNPGFKKRSNYERLREFDKVWNNLQPWPLFVNQRMIRQIQEMSVKLFNIIKTIPQRFFNNNIEQISQYYGMPLEIVTRSLYGLNRIQLDNLLGRGDFVLSENGFKCLEYNISSSLGGWNLDLLSDFYRQGSVIRKFLGDYRIKTMPSRFFSTVLERMIRLARGAFPKEKNEINIAIAMPDFHKKGAGRGKKEQVILNQIYRNILKKKFGDFRGEVILCDAADMEIKDGLLWVGKSRIHVLLEMYFGKLPFEILEIGKERQVLIFNGPSTWLFSNKINLAILSENEDSEILTTEERDVVKKYVPWTRRVESGIVTYEKNEFRLEEFIVSNRKRFVLKPSEGYGGEGVYVGEYISDSQWGKLVANALKEKSWIVQEYYQSLPYLFQAGEIGGSLHQAVWGFMVFGTEYVGGILRVLANEKCQGVINSHQGAEKTVIFQVEE
jgi:hypothetical protein